MIDRIVMKRMTSIARALDAAGSSDLSDRIEMVLRFAQTGGSDFESSNPDSVQSMEPTLRKKPVRPFIGDGFEESNDPNEFEEDPKVKPKKVVPKKSGVEIGVDVALNNKPKKPEKES